MCKIIRGHCTALVFRLVKYTFAGGKEDVQKAESFVFDNFLPLNTHREAGEIQTSFRADITLTLDKESIFLLFGHPLYFYFFKLAILSVKVLILASASACFCFSLATTASGALLTKRSLPSFFITPVKKPCW